MVVLWPSHRYLLLPCDMPFLFAIPLVWLCPVSRILFGRPRFTRLCAGICVSPKSGLRSTLSSAHCSQARAAQWRGQRNSRDMSSEETHAAPRADPITRRPADQISVPLCNGLSLAALSRSGARKLPGCNQEFSQCLVVDAVKTDQDFRILGVVLRDVVNARLRVQQGGSPFCGKAYHYRIRFRRAVYGRTDHEFPADV